MKKGISLTRSDALDDSVMIVSQRPQKSNRGRKAVDLDEYINRSKQQIATWQAQLEILRKTKPKKDCDLLYNKITALQSRLRRKQELKQAKCKWTEQNKQFDKLCKVLERTVQPACQKRIAEKMLESELLTGEEKARIKQEGEKDLIGIMKLLVKMDDVFD